MVIIYAIGLIMFLFWLISEILILDVLGWFISKETSDRYIKLLEDGEYEITPMIILCLLPIPTGLLRILTIVYLLSIIYIILE